MNAQLDKTDVTVMHHVMIHTVAIHVVVVVVILAMDIPVQVRINYFFRNVMTIICLDINECSGHTHDCDHDATCTDTLGSYRCSCNTGFNGNGQTCTGNTNNIII